MKKNQLVQIPIDHVCINIDDLMRDYMKFNELSYTVHELRSQIRDKDEELDATKAKLSISESKVADLEKERARIDKESLDWYRKYAALRDKYEPRHNEVKSNAETEES